MAGVEVALYRPRLRALGGPPGRLANHDILGERGALGNVFGPSGGFADSPLAGDLVTPDVAALYLPPPKGTGTATPAPTPVPFDPGTPGFDPGTPGNESPGGGAGDGGAGDGSGVGDGSGAAGDGGGAPAGDGDAGDSL